MGHLVGKDYLYLIIIATFPLTFCLFNALFDGIGMKFKASSMAKYCINWLMVKAKDIIPCYVTYKGSDSKF